MISSPFRLSREIYVPQLENGTLYYTIMEIVAANEADSGWAVKDKLAQPFPTATEPEAVGLKAISGLNSPRNSKIGFKSHQHGVNWSVSGFNIE